MKKLLMNAAIATGLALFAGNAFAADAGASVTSIGFESTPQGQLDVSLDDQGYGGTTYWNDSGDDESTIVTNYADTAVTPPTSRPDLFAETSNSIFLKIDSPNGIERYMAADGAEGGSVSLDNDYFVDMNVQFTVSDTVLDLGENTDNDKLAIWLYAPDTENATTNLVITAATVDGNGKPTAKNFVATLENPVVPDKWYRLTVKAVGAVAPKGPCFNVYVDGEKVSSSATVEEETFETAVSDFYSLVRYAASEPTTKTLSSVTFHGVGALDDLAFTTTKPGFIPAETQPFAVGENGYPTFAAAVAAAGGNTIRLLEDYDVAKEDGITFTSGTATLDIGSFSLTDTRKSITEEDIFAAVTVSGGTLTIIGSGNIGVPEGELNDSVVVQNGGTLALGAAESSVPTLSAGIFVSESYTVKVWGSAEPGEGVNVYDGESSLTWNAPQTTPGYYIITTGGGEEPSEGYDSGDGVNTFTIAADREAALETNLPTGKTLASTVSETSSMTYAQAYALGLWSENSAEVEDLEATISFDKDGKVVVSLANEPATGYLVTCKVYEKASLTAEWPAEPITTYAYGSEQAITPVSDTAGFYKVEVTISNASGN